MKKGVTIIKTLSLIVILILIVSCSRIPGGENPSDTASAAQAVKTGTQGVELSFLNNFPPTTIYDQSELIAMLEIRNRGNYDLSAQDCFIHVTGFDKNIIKGDFLVPRACSGNVGTLEGKNLYNTEGSFNQLEFSSRSPVTLPTGVYDYDPMLNFNTCYHYNTKASPKVCVDPLFYQVTSEQKSCTPRNIGMGGGQGGPVGVSYVGVNMIGSKATFEITVNNFGSGRVLSPNTDIRSCGDYPYEYSDLDRVYYQVQLSGASPIDCKPQDYYIRMSNSQGKAVCSFNLASGGAYETLLTIDLDYNYIQQLKKQVRIIKTPE